METKIMLQCMTSNEAEKYADHILMENEYSYAAYNVKAVAAMDREDYCSMIDYKQKALKITRYTLEEYEDYIVMLNIALDYYSINHDKENYNNCVENIKEIKYIIKEVEEGTNSLSYKLNVKPDFVLPDEYVRFIEQF